LARGTRGFWSGGVSPPPGTLAMTQREANPRSTMAEEPYGCYMTAMANVLSTYIVPLAIAAVAVVLVLGLYNMLRGGSPNLSQNLMRWRVVLQFIAIIIIMLTVWAMRQ
jgi:hypothetical protein